MIDYRNINENESGLSVRAKINTMFADLISGEEGVNNVWGKLVEVINGFNALELSVDDVYAELKGQVLKGFDYTDATAEDLRTYINGMNGGISGFAVDTSFNPNFPEDKAATVLAAGAGTYVNMLDVNGNPITIEDADALTVFYKGANSTYWQYKSVYARIVIDREEGLESSEITIANSDKIGFFSNSLNGYCMLGKHAINNLSMFSDYIMYNYGHSGDDLLGILTGVNDNQSWLGDVPVQEWGIKYGIIVMQDKATSDIHYENVKKLANAIKAMGGIPILGTTYEDYYYYNFVRLANDYGITFMDWARRARRLYMNVFGPFWQDSHPATRTGWMWTYGMKPYLDSLPRPDRVIKLFRVRPSVELSDVQNLMYEDISSRASLFEEITCGVIGLAKGTEKYFDRLDTGRAAYQTYKDEYQILQSKSGNVSFGNFALVEVVVPYDKNGCRQLTGKISGTGIDHIYIRKINSLSSLSNPLGEWIDIEGTSGEFDLSEHLSTCMDFDKVSLLLEGTSIEISDVKFSVSGTTKKEKKSLDRVVLAKHGTSLLPNIRFDDDDDEWYGIGEISKYTPVKSTVTERYEPLPYGIVTVRHLSKGQKLMQEIHTGLIKDDLEFSPPLLQIRVIARYFPEYIDTDDKWSSSKIKRGSYDCANLAIRIASSLTDSYSFKVSVIPVGMWWNEFIIETPYYNFHPYIILEAEDDDIQLARCEVLQIN